MGATKVVGVDVGLASAAAALYGYTRGSNLPRLIATTRIPTLGEAGGKRIDVRAFSEWLIRTGATVAYVENATAMPAIPDQFGHRRGMGAGTMARYMRAVGAIEACVTLAGMDSVLVMPAVWKRALGLRKADKKQSVILARELFPDRADTTFKHWASHNLAEAALLSLYAGIRTDLVILKAAA